MLDLENFLFKNVIAVDTDGIEYKGYVDSFETADDNEGEGDEDSIGIITDEKRHLGVELFQSEIKSIEIIKGE